MKGKILTLSLLIVFAFSTAKSQWPPVDPNEIAYVGDFTTQEISDFGQYLDQNPFGDPDPTFVPTTVSDCYDNDQSECSTWDTWQTGFKAVVRVPLYPHCPLDVTFSTRSCSSNPLIVQISIDSWTQISGGGWFPPLHYGCLIDNAAFFSLTTVQQAEELNQMECDLYGLLSKYIFTEINKKHILTTGYPIYCGSGNEQVKVSYTKGSCSGFCVKITSMENGETRYSVKTAECMDAFCCRFKHEFCVDPNTEKLIHTTSKDVDPHDPCEGLAPTTGCYGPSMFTTGCVESCDIEFMNLGD